MQDFWRVPFTIMMSVLLALLVFLGLCHSITMGIILGVFGWLMQGLCMWMVTECNFPKVILTNWLSLWSDTILKWTINDK